MKYLKSSSLFARIPSSSETSVLLRSTYLLTRCPMLVKGITSAPTLLREDNNALLQGYTRDVYDDECNLDIPRECTDNLMEGRKRFKSNV